jgi:hypothetical protein
LNGLDIIHLGASLSNLCTEVPVKKMSSFNKESVPEIPKQTVENAALANVESTDSKQTVSGNFIPFENLHNVCFPFQNQGYCLRGNRCKFDHFPPELCPCFEWSKGNCSRGYGCRFAHLEPRPPIPRSLMHKMEKRNLKLHGEKSAGPGPLSDVKLSSSTHM